MLQQWSGKEAELFMPKSFAEMLKELRDEHGLTGMQIEEMTGIDQGLISKYEKGERTPKAPNINKLAKLFGVDPKPMLMAAGRLSVNDAPPGIADPDAARLLEAYSKLEPDNKQVAVRVMEAMGGYGTMTRKVVVPVYIRNEDTGLLREVPGVTAEKINPTGDTVLPLVVPLSEYKWRREANLLRGTDEALDAPLQSVENGEVVFAVPTTAKE